MTHSSIQKVTLTNLSKSKWIELNIEDVSSTHEKVTLTEFEHIKINLVDKKKRVIQSSKRYLN